MEPERSPLPVWIRGVFITKAEFDDLEGRGILKETNNAQLILLHLEKGEPLQKWVLDGRGSPQGAILPLQKFWLRRETKEKGTSFEFRRLLSQANSVKAFSTVKILMRREPDKFSIAEGLLAYMGTMWAKCMLVATGISGAIRMLLARRDELVFVGSQKGNGINVAELILQARHATEQGANSTVDMHSIPVGRVE